MHVLVAPQGFTIDADYEETKVGTQLAAGVSRSVGKFTIANPPEDALPADGSAPKIRVNFNYDMSGVFSVHSAQVFKAVAPEPEEAPAEAAPADADGDVKMDADTPAADAGEGAGEDEASKKAAEEKAKADAEEKAKADAAAAAAAPVAGTFATSACVVWCFLVWVLTCGECVVRAQRRRPPPRSSTPRCP